MCEAGSWRLGVDGGQLSVLSYLCPYSIGLLRLGWILFSPYSILYILTLEVWSCSPTDAALRQMLHFDSTSTSSV